MLKFVAELYQWAVKIAFSVGPRPLFFSFFENVERHAQPRGADASLSPSLKISRSSSRSDLPQIVAQVHGIPFEPIVGTEEGPKIGKAFVPPIRIQTKRT
jgi:hypothetical protein